MMTVWKVTIKEKLCEKPIVTRYIGDVDRKFVSDFYGCEQPDVEWYDIEKEA